MSTVIKVEGLSKSYRLGQIGGKRLVDDVNRWWAKLRGKEDPLAKIGMPGIPANGSDEVIWSLQDVSFEVKQGEVLGVIGRNGAGKSTLLKILSRVTAPTTGQIKVRGRIASLLEVGTGFHPELTGRENIYLNGAILGMTKAEIRSKFGEIVEFAEIAKFIDTPVKRYSSGMYVRLAFAVAAHLEPEILIVDEVLAVGDHEFQKKCLGKMKDVASEGRTVLFVSHNMQAVTRLCSQALLLAGGTVEDMGPANTICSRYLSDGGPMPHSRIWDPQSRPSGNSWVQLRSLSATGSKGGSSETVDIRQPVKITVEYKVLKPGKALIPNIHFSNDEGTLLFVLHEWSEEWKRQPKEPGLYRTEFIVPGNLLNSGRIYVRVAISTYAPFEVHVDERDPISFLVTDTPDQDGARGDYAGVYPGMIRPLVPSSTMKLRSTS